MIDYDRWTITDSNGTPHPIRRLESNNLSRCDLCSGGGGSRADYVTVGIGDDEDGEPDGSDYYACQGHMEYLHNEISVLDTETWTPPPPPTIEDLLQMFGEHAALVQYSNGDQQVVIRFY